MVSSWLGERDAAERDAAEERLGMGDGGWPGEDRHRRELPRELLQRHVADRAGQHVDEPSQRRVRDRRQRPRGGGVAAVAIGEARMVEHDRDAGDSGSAGERGGDPAGEHAGGGERRREQRGSGADRCDVLGGTGTEERAGTAALRRLGRRDADDEVGSRGAWGGSEPAARRRAPERRSSSLVASCTSTVPRKSRAPVGRRTTSSSRRPARRSSPPAIRIVCCSAGIPSRSSSSITAATACWRGSIAAPGSGSERGSTTIVTRPPRVARSVSGGPESG